MEKLWEKHMKPGPTLGAGEPPKLSKEFLEALQHNLALFSEVWDREVTPLKAVGYREALKNLSVQEMNRACALALRRCKNFPAPADILEAANEPSSERQFNASEGCDRCGGCAFETIEHDGSRYAVPCGQCTEAGRKRELAKAASSQPSAGEEADFPGRNP